MDWTAFAALLHDIVTSVRVSGEEGRLHALIDDLFNGVVEGDAKPAARPAASKLFTPA